MEDSQIHEFAREKHLHKKLRSDSEINILSAPNYSNEMELYLNIEFLFKKKHNELVAFVMRLQKVLTPLCFEHAARSEQ